MLFNGKEYPQAEIVAARKYAAEPSKQCADHALDDEFGFASHITHKDKLEYIADRKQRVIDIENGMLDNCFTVWQRINEYLTGKCVTLLP